MDANTISAKIIKAEMSGNMEKVAELKKQLEQVKKCDFQGDNRKSRSSDSRSQSKVNADELNKLNAKIIKAEMLGDMDRVVELKRQLEKLTHQEEDPQESHGSNKLGPQEKPKQNVKLIQLARKISDDRFSLKQMFVKAKRGEVEDEAKLFLASSSKVLNVDEEYEGTAKKKKKIEEKKVYERIVDEEEQECEMCIPRIKRHLIVTIMDTTYLCCPSHEPFVNGHCFIRSRSHIRCTVEAEENCLAEILTLRKKLCIMFDAQNLGVVFTELFFKKGRNQHFQIECFPVKKRLMPDAKMYFKKAILECEMEWSMNKKLIDIKDRCITKSIPKGLSYFWVSFGPSNDSFGHVIEEEKYFPKHFAHEIIAGLLDIDRFRYTKPRNETFDQQYDRVTKFKSTWKKFDSPGDASLSLDT